MAAPILFRVSGITSKKTTTSKATIATRKAAVAKGKALLGADPTRSMALLFVKVFIISHLHSFNLADSADVRMFFSVVCIEGFPSALYPKLVKHYITELYSATVSRLRHSLRAAVGNAGGPLLHANFDLWTSKVSNEKYLGEHFMCKKYWVLC